MKKTKKTMRFICIVFILIVNFQLPLAYAQGPGFEDDVEDTPLDGGVTLVAAAAIGYGAKRMASKRKAGK